jgi:hypothetical protein
MNNLNRGLSYVAAHHKWKYYHGDACYLKIKGPLNQLNNGKQRHGQPNRPYYLLCQSLTLTYDNELGYRDSLKLWAFYITVHLLLCPDIADPSSSKTPRRFRIISEFVSSIMMVLTQHCGEYSSQNIKIRHRILAISIGLLEASYESNRYLNEQGIVKQPLYPKCHSHVLEIVLPLLMRLRKDDEKEIEYGLLQYLYSMLDMDLDHDALEGNS